MRPSRLGPGGVAALSLGGAIVPILDVAVVTVLGSLQPAYSHLGQFISELGESGRPFAALANLWFVLASVMFGGFAVALLVGTPPSRATTVGALLFGAWAVTGILGGFFPCDPGCGATTFLGVAHVMLGEVGAICLLPVPMLIWLGARGDPRWAGYGWFTLAVQVLASGSLLLLGAAYFGISPLAPMLEAGVGLLQRVSLGVYYTWTGVVGLKIARTSLQSSDDAAPKRAPRWTDPRDR